MDIQRLKEFVTLASHLRLSSAARELFMSPSTLSQHISALEKELGCDLFDRSGGFELTPKGELALEHAQKILFEYDALIRDCSRSKSDNVISLSMPTYYMGQNALVAAREPFLRTHPGYRVMIGTNAYDNEDPFEILADGRSEISGLYLVRGSGRTIDMTVPEGISAVRVGAYECVFLSQTSNALSNVSILTAEQLNGCSVTLRLCPVSSILMDGVQAVLRQQGVYIRVLFRRETRNSDAFLHDLNNTFVQWFERVDDNGKPMNDMHEDEIAPGITIHHYEHPIIADAYLLYMPSKLNAAQLDYLAEVKRMAGE